MLQTPMTGGQPVTITFLRANGELVQPGDEVVKFDTTEQEFRLREAEADLAEAEQQIVQATSEAEAKEEETRCELLEGRRRVQDRRSGDAAQRDRGQAVAHENELALEAARQKRAKLEKDLKNRLETGRSGIEMQQAARAKAEVKAKTARRNIESMTLRAKATGYVAIQQNDDGNLRWGMYLPPYQVGDIARPGKGGGADSGHEQLGSDGAYRRTGPRAHRRGSASPRSPLWRCRERACTGRSRRSAARRVRPGTVISTAALLCRSRSRSCGRA